MKSIPASMRAALDGGATHFARCVKITRRDGTVLGLTEHDFDLVIGGVTYRADAGLDPSAVETPLGLAVSDSEMAGAISHDAIDAAALDGGLYDAAAVELFLVDWQAPGERIILRTGEIGEVRREGIAFVAELRGLSHRLSQTIGRVFQHLCDADLGDARCGIDLALGAWRGEGIVTAVAASRRFSVSGLGAFASAHFERGRLRFSSGENIGAESEVRRHLVNAGIVTIELWSKPPYAVASGDAFVVTAGCGKSFSECRTRFANGHNFRGFPTMPGNDWIAITPRRGGRNDGGSR